MQVDYCEVHDRAGTVERYSTALGQIHVRWDESTRSLAVEVWKTDASGGRTGSAVRSFWPAGTVEQLVLRFGLDEPGAAPELFGDVPAGMGMQRSFVGAPPPPNPEGGPDD